MYRPPRERILVGGPFDTIMLEPLASEKVEGPATCPAFLGIELDSNAMQVRLPDRKLVKVKLLVNQ